MYALLRHINDYYGRFKKVVSSLREDRKWRVIKWRWLFGIMNFAREKNLHWKGLAGKLVLEQTRQVAVVEVDMLLKFLADFDMSGDVAHFFYALIWTNEIGAMVKSDAGLAIEFMVKTAEN